MKIWIKLLAGIFIGAILTLFLPLDNANWQESLFFISEMIIRLGRYIAFPLFFFTLATGIHELQREKQLISVFAQIIIFTLAASFLLVFLGTLASTLFPTPRIPIVVENSVVPEILSFTDSLRQVIPYNLFTVFSGEANFLLPLYVLAVILGLNFSFDKTLAAPAHQFFHSMGLVFYHVNSFFAEILGLGMMALTITFFIQVKGIIDIQMFGSLIILIGFLTLAFLGGIFPLIVYLLDPQKENPFKVLYGSLGALLGAWFSGDIYFSTALLLKHSQENHGVPRRISAVYLPFASMFSRAGTGMISAISMVVILQSYSSLEITFYQLFWVMGSAFMVSFILPAIPGQGVFVSQILLCRFYGRGLEEGFLLLKPIAPVLMSFSILLDIGTNGFINTLIGMRTKTRKEIAVANYI